MEDAAGSGETLHARCTILSSDIFSDAARSTAPVFHTPAYVIRHGTDGNTPQDSKTAIGSTRLASPFQIGGSTTSSLNRTGSQDIISPRESIFPQWSRDAQQFDTSINGIYSEHRDPAPTRSKVIAQKFTNKSSAEVNLRCRMNLTRDAVLAKSPNFVNLGLSYVETSDELRSVFIPTTRIIIMTDGSNWIPPGHIIGEVTADRVIRTGS